MRKYRFWWKMVWLLFFLLPCSILAQTDAKLWEKIRAAGSPADYPGENVVTVLERTTVHVHGSGYTVVENHSINKILSNKGARTHSVYRFGYDPLTNYIEVAGVRVFRQKGTIEKIDLKQIVDLPAPAGIILWGGRMKVISLPKLEIGDAVEVKTIKKGFKIAYLNQEEKYIPPMYGHFHDVVYFQSSRPIKEKWYVLRVPRDKLIQYEIYNGQLQASLFFDGDTLQYVWKDYDIPPFKSEAQMVSFSDVAPKLVIATLPDWESKSRWFYKTNEPQFEVDEAIREKVKEIAAGLKTEEQKISALTHWVAQNIRYLGLCMGKGEGYTTHPVAMTFRDRGGVCKDKAGLLVAMLREIGVEAYLVMTEAGARVEPIPADQFNHAVVAIRRKDGSFRLLDPTWAPNSRELWSSAEAEQHVVIGTPEGQSLALSPYVLPEENYLKITVESVVNEQGDLSSKLTLVADGAPDTQLRGALARTPVDNRHYFFEKMITQIAPNAYIRNLFYTDPEDFSQPTKIEITFMAPEYAVANGKYIWLTPVSSRLLLADAQLADYSKVAKLPSRKYPFRLRATRLVECSESIRLPKGFDAQWLPEPMTINGEASDFRLSISTRGRTVKVYHKLVLKKRVYPAESYHNFRQAVNAVTKLAEIKIVASK